ncbi:MAG: STAS domain-containing protein, partial [Pseudomonadota bacterium]|nr:STAS domain-containing protein [Pseudomonadota bacterium]
MNKQEGPQHRWQAAQQGWTLELSGDWRAARVLSLTPPPPALDLALSPGLPLAVSAAGLRHWDTGLTAALHQRLAPLARAGLTLDLHGLPDDVRSVLELSLPSA